MPSRSNDPTASAQRLLFVHEVDYRSKVVYEVHEFPELLALRGKDVSFFHFPENAGRHSLRTHRERVAGRAYPDASITLITPPTWGGGPLERYAAPLLNLPALRHEIVHGGYDAVVLYAVPTTGWQTVRLAERAGVPVLFRALDVSHEIRRTPVAPLIRLAERSVYRRSTLVAANNPALAEYCTQVAEGARTTVLLPPVDLDHFRHRAASVRGRYGIPDSDTVLLYMGTFFEFSGLDVVIARLADRLRGRTDLKVVLVGSGPLDGALRALVEREGLGDRVIFTGVVSYDELPGHLAMADVALNPFRVEKATELALPHKVLQYAAAGRPVVSTRLAGLAGVLGEDSGVCWAADPADAAELALELAAAPAAERDRRVATARERVAELFDLDRVASAFQGAIDGLL